MSMDVIWRKSVSTNAISEIHAGGVGQHGEKEQTLGDVIFFKESR